MKELLEEYGFQYVPAAEHNTIYPGVENVWFQKLDAEYGVAMGLVLYEIEGKFHRMIELDGVELEDFEVRDEANLKAAIELFGWE